MRSISRPLPIDTARLYIILLGSILQTAQKWTFQHVMFPHFVGKHYMGRSKISRWHYISTPDPTQR